MCEFVGHHNGRHDKFNSTDRVLWEKEDEFLERARV